MTKASSEPGCSCSLLHTYSFCQICSAMNSLKHRHICHNTTHALNNSKCSTLSTNTHIAACMTAGIAICHITYHILNLRPDAVCLTPHLASRKSVYLKSKLQQDFQGPLVWCQSVWQQFPQRSTLLFQLARRHQPQWAPICPQ